MVINQLRNSGTLMSVTKNVLELFFKILPDEDSNNRADFHICATIEGNVLPSQSSAYNKKI